MEKEFSGKPAIENYSKKPIWKLAKTTQNGFLE